jgi:hypothetical protein
VSYKLISLYSHHHFLNYNLAFCLTSLCILIFLFYFHNKEKQKRSTLFSFSFSSESRNNLVYSGTDTEDQILGTRFLIKENHLWFFAKAGPLDSGKRPSIQELPSHHNMHKRIKRLHRNAAALTHPRIPRSRIIIPSLFLSPNQTCTQ